MRLPGLMFGALLACAGMAGSQLVPAISLAAARRPVSGIDSPDLDRGVRAQDDFYRHAVGGWIARVKAPDYMPGWSASRELQLAVYQALDRDVQGLARTPGIGADERRLSDLYASYMDVARIDAAGLAPLDPWLRRIDAAASPGDMLRVVAGLSAQGLDIGIGVWVHADDQEPTRYLADIVQSDLGLPDRAYYLDEQPRFTRVRDAYRGHVARLLALSGVADAETRAGAVVALETRLAAAQWTEVAVRVPGATAHRAPRAGLATAISGIDLGLFADGVGIPAGADRFNLAEPDYLAAYGRTLSDVPLPVWRAYLRYRLLDHLARFLPEPYRAEADLFWTRTVAGATGIRPRWLRAMGMLEDAMGDALGQLYVERHFPPEAKAGAMTILDNVVAAFRRRIAGSDWLSTPGKRAALAKLDAVVIRMGAPDQIRDYAGLRTDPTDAVGNWMRARQWAARFEIDKLGRAVDREEWTMSPQSVNGAYSVSRNQVVLTAALLQPPYFRADADIAVNYGALGYYIAHELTHGFDRAGSQYDGAGRRVEWMTPADRTAFERRVYALVGQYGRYEALPGHRLDGELTIGENIADVSGLAIAHDAYRLALAGRAAPRIDGLSGDQRFYLGFARIWASEPIRTEAEMTGALADTHAPDRFRVIGAVANQDGFHAAFGVGPGDAMYLPPADRVRIW